MRQSNYGEQSKSRKLFKTLSEIMVIIFSAFGAGGISAAYLIPKVYEQRGYWGIGGEWLLILIIAYAVGRFTYCIFKDVEDGDVK